MNILADTTNGGLSGGIIALIVVLVVVLIIAISFIGWWIRTSNRLKTEQIKIDEAASGIDVALTKRYDLLTKEVAVVKGYAKHESETLANVISMRRPSGDASMKEKADFATQVTKAFDSINIVAEQYPDLKANTNFMSLQNQIADVEEQLQAARRVYNSNVTVFNQDIVVFPSSMVANHLHLVKRDFFEAEEAKRQDVKIEF
jgi:LemA protein